MGVMYSGNRYEELNMYLHMDLDSSMSDNIDLCYLPLPLR